MLFENCNELLKMSWNGNKWANTEGKLRLTRTVEYGIYFRFAQVPFSFSSLQVSISFHYTRNRPSYSKQIFILLKFCLYFRFIVCSLAFIIRLEEKKWNQEKSVLKKKWRRNRRTRRFSFSFLKGNKRERFMRIYWKTVFLGDKYRGCGMNNRQWVLN